LEQKSLITGSISNSTVIDVFTVLHKYHSASTTEKPFHLI